MEFNETIRKIKWKRVNEPECKSKHNYLEPKIKTNRNVFTNKNNNAKHTMSDKNMRKQ